MVLKEPKAIKRKMDKTTNIKSEEIKIGIAIPVYNEEEILEKNINRLIDFLKNNFTYKNFKIIILDNGSVDNTWDIAQKLMRKYPEVSCIHLTQKGRGGALKKAWLESDADIVSYMDADLSADLEAFPKLIDLITLDGYDIAVGSRLLPHSKVKRTPLREFISFAYNTLIKNIFHLKQFPDAQCGFKALRKKVIAEVVPEIKNKNWFFDTELLVLAEKNGFKINYTPINWDERLKSRVRLWHSILEHILGILRLKIKNKL